MKVFVSWSGDRSKSVAKALREWLPVILHYAEPWLSEADIGAGDRWSSEVAKQLEQSSFGIVCLTQDNLSAPWILFEAGALAKFVDSSAVCPYLFDLEFRDLSGPLSQFQAKKANRESTFELIQSLNQNSDVSVPEDRLGELFNALWPALEEKLKSIPPAEPEAREAPARDTDVLLEKLFSAVMGIESRLKRIEEDTDSLTRTKPRSNEMLAASGSTVRASGRSKGRIYVGNLPFSATEREVKELFEEFGQVEEVLLISDGETGRPRGFGFVTMLDGVEDAVEALNGLMLGGRSLNINEARLRTDLTLD